MRNIVINRHIHSVERVYSAGKTDGEGGSQEEALFNRTPTSYPRGSQEAQTNLKEAPRPSLNLHPPNLTLIDIKAEDTAFSFCMYIHFSTAINVPIVYIWGGTK